VDLTTGVGVVLLKSTMAPYLVPGAVGLKVKFTVQLCVAAYAVPTVQVPPLATLKSRPVAPWVTTLIEPRVKLLVNVIVAVWVALAVPTGSVGAVICERSDCLPTNNRHRYTPTSQWIALLRREELKQTLLLVWTAVDAQDEQYTRRRDRLFMAGAPGKNMAILWHSIRCIARSHSSELLTSV
jgi:hypothetical protein